MRFKVNSLASQIVIGVALIPAVLSLAAAFGLFDRGDTWLGALAAAGFVVILMPAGLLARRWSRELEVDERAMREHGRDGTVIEIRWDQPHELLHETRIARRAGVAVVGSTRVTLTAGASTIRFSTTASRGMVGLASKLPGAVELRTGADAVARAIELSTAAQLAAARARLDAGERVELGKVAVSSRGLHLGDVVVPRASARVVPARGRGGRAEWTIEADGKNHRFALADLPNIAVLEALLAG